MLAESWAQNTAVWFNQHDAEQEDQLELPGH
jgi:hypothetical protein